MAGEGTAAGGMRASGLLSSIRNLASTLVELAQTRLQLLANEIREEKLRLSQLVLFAAAAVFFAALGIIMLTLLVIILFWDDNRLLAVGGFAAFYSICGIVFAAAAVKRVNAHSHLFEASLRELAKDRERLSS
jgi:uncharacterized membrane protein YqjE